MEMKLLCQPDSVSLSHSGPSGQEGSWCQEPRGGNDRRTGGRRAGCDGILRGLAASLAWGWSLLPPSSIPAQVDPKEEGSNYTAELNMRS